MSVITDSLKLLVVALLARLATDELPLGIPFGARYEEAGARLEEFVEASGLEAATGFIECDSDPELSMIVKQFHFDGPKGRDFVIQTFFDGEGADMLSFSCDLAPMGLLEAELALEKSARSAGFTKLRRGVYMGTLWRLYRGGDMGLLVERSDELRERMGYRVLLFRRYASEGSLGAWNEHYGGSFITEDALTVIERIL